MHVDTAMSTGPNSFVTIGSADNFVIKVFVGKAGKLICRSISFLSRRSHTNHLLVARTMSASSQVRRILPHQIEENGSVSFDIFIQKLQAVEVLPTHGRFVFSYQDKDGDIVSVSSTPELIDAMEQFTEQGTLKLVQQVNQENTEVSSNVADANSEHQIAEQSVIDTVSEIFGDDQTHYGDTVVGKSSKKVLHHIVDSFKDHITSAFCPLLRKDKNDQLIATYTIDGEKVKSKYFAIDKVYLDLDNNLNSLRVSQKAAELMVCALTNTSTPPVKTTFRGGSWQDEFLHCSISVVGMDRTPMVFLQHVDTPHGPRVSLVSKGTLSSWRNHGKLCRMSGIFTATVTHTNLGWSISLTLVGVRAYSLHDKELLL